MIYKIVFLICVIGVVNCKDCDKTKCYREPKHYKELECEPVMDEDDCCEIRYDCPDLSKLDKKKCHFRGKEFSYNEKLPTNETSRLCAAECYCDKYGPIAEFSCAQIECPDLFNPNLYHCARESSLDKCCPTKYICDPKEITALPTCEYDSKTYKKGDFIYPDDVLCHRCLCDEEFDNTTVKGNPKCQEIDCGITLRYMKKLQEGCIPIYYKTSDCCPIDWKCPSKSDAIISTEDTKNIKSDTEKSKSEQESKTLEKKLDSKKNDEKMTCKFGELKLNIGESIKPDDKCDECKCILPPMLHCVKKPNC